MIFPQNLIDSAKPVDSVDNDVNKKKKLADPEYLPELLECLNDTGPNQRQKRIDMLKSFVAKDAKNEMTLRGFVECVFHPQVVFDLPPSNPPYRENDSPDYDMNGRTLYNFFYERMPLYFVKGTSRYVQNQTRREMLFIQQLEALHKEESKCLLMMKNKELRACKKFLNYGLFKEAFPEWLPELPNVA